MQNDNYIAFEILGINRAGRVDSFVFSDKAICEIQNDPIISKITVAEDISHAVFYLHDTLDFANENIRKIISHLYTFLGSMMISLLKHSSRYPNSLLMPTIRLSSINIMGEDRRIELRDYVSLSDDASIQVILNDGNEILDKWVHDVSVSHYTLKKGRYDILFLLLQGHSAEQKYMALYAYLMSLVREIYSKPKEGQKQVVQYVTDNCSRVGITLCLSPSTRPNASPADNEDQFTALRNKIGHPDVRVGLVRVSDNAINGLTSLICCALEDVSI